MKTIELTRDKVALVDDEDYDDLIRYKWSTLSSGNNRYYYAVRWGRPGERDVVLMHNHLLGSLGVDHINGDGLDNQRSNLRSATKTQNGQNRKPNKNCVSEFKGINQRPNGKWYVRIQVDGKRISLGYFNDEIDAAKAYDEAARRYFGEYARTNF